MKHAHEVALSFAGEQRSYAREVARALQAQGVAVFFDEFEEISLWGKGLSEELQKVYEHQAEYVVLFISREYVEKAWPTHERRSALSRAVREKREYLLPVRFDDTLVPGLPSDVSYLTAKTLSPVELAAKICEKIGIDPLVVKASAVPPPVSTAARGELAFDYSSYNGRYVIGREPADFETKWSKASNTSIYVLNDPPSIRGVAVAKKCRSISEVKTAYKLDFTSRIRTPRVGEVVVLQNTKGFFAALEILEIKDDTRGDEVDELRFRYLIKTDGSYDFSK